MRMLDLHIHLGGAIPAPVLWEILCDGGLTTGYETYEDLLDFLTVDKNKLRSLDDFLGRYFHATELIQSSPQAASAAAYQAIAKSYRRAQIGGIELRYNPLKRTRQDFHTLDSIILASIQGLQKASMHYRVRTGIIFSLGKELDLESNEKIIDAAIRFHRNGELAGAHGVIGLDMAGPESKRMDHDRVWLKDVARMLEKAKTAGLGTTWHVGETDCSGPDALENILEIIQPDRIGHGIQLRKAEGKQKERLCKMLSERQVCLEICPSVNLITRSVESLEEIADVLMLADKEGIPFCLNTDNPYLIRTNLAQEYSNMEEVLPKEFNLREKAFHWQEQATFMKSSQCKESH